MDNVQINKIRKCIAPSSISFRVIACYRACLESVLTMNRIQCSWICVGPHIQYRYLDGLVEKFTWFPAMYSKQFV